MKIEIISSSIEKNINFIFTEPTDEAEGAEQQWQDEQCHNADQGPEFLLILIKLIMFFWLLIGSDIEIGGWGGRRRGGTDQRRQEVELISDGRNGGGEGWSPAGGP